jgi:hypothetical protein
MPPLDELYEYHAHDCVHSARLTDDPKRRELLLKLAREWTQEAAALRRPIQSVPHGNVGNEKKAGRQRGPEARAG